MPGPSTLGTGVPSLVLRFAGIFVLAMYLESAEINWLRVQGHDTLQQPPFNPHTLYATGLAYKWARLIWNIVLWLPTAVAPSILVWLIGIFDVVLTVYLGIATVLQGQFTPPSSSACQHADTWQVHGNATESFFHAVAGFNATRISAEEVCKEFVFQWRLGLASLVLYCIVSFCNTFLSLLLSMRSAGGVPDASWLVTSFEILVASFLLPPRIAVYFLCLLFVLLPKCTKPPVRFVFRSVSKACQTIYIPIWRRLKLLRVWHFLSRRHRPRAENEGEEWNKTIPVSGCSALADFLHIDILTLVSEHLHYQDLVNLSLTSKRLRATVFPNGHGRSGASILRRYACNPATRSQCWVCTMPLCSACHNKRQFSTRQLQRSQKSHETCKPLCTSCFYKTIATHKLRFGTTKFYNFCQRDYRKQQGGYCDRPQNGTDENFIRSLCRRCDMLPKNKCLELLRQRELAEMNQMKESAGYTCCVCSGGVSRGLMWWKCTSCGGECQDPMVHPAWNWERPPPPKQLDVELGEL
ncbi:hypothetical protein FQN52_004805 [Onygenales sp. PD_12]|nr:hypothetical protein FQN52_004805 [Onygenales sp. PD_12]